MSFLPICLTYCSKLSVSQKLASLVMESWASSVPRKAPSLPSSGNLVTILSIDGGGVRGLIPAVILRRLEKELPVPTFSNYFFTSSFLFYKIKYFNPYISFCLFFFIVTHTHTFTFVFYFCLSYVYLYIINSLFSCAKLICQLYCYSLVNQNFYHVYIFFLVFLFTLIFYHIYIYIYIFI